MHMNTNETGITVNGRSGIETDHVSLFSENYLEIFYDRQISSIHAIWKGYQSVESIQEGCERILDLMVVYDTYRVLYDHTHMVGIWRFAAMWLAAEWFPRMKQAGLTHFAWVYSSAKLSQLSTDMTLSLMEPEPLGVKVFHDIDAAKTWLWPRFATELSEQPERLRAVVIDDNRDFAQMFRNMLEIMGCDAIPAAAADAGIELIKANPPDIIFCDIGLPGAMDGFDFARALKADERFSPIPLIAVSGYASDENRQRAIHAGFDRVWSKPVKFEEVSEVLAALPNR
jgi:CheY-like chemotaxis protein